MQQRKWGFKKQPFDEMDLRYSAAKPLSGLPKKSNLDDQLPDCWDQGFTSSCTAHGIDACLWSGQVIIGDTPVMPSRLFMYWNERSMEGDTSKDDGAYIRDGIKVCNIYGIAPESLWPFDESKVLTRPVKDAYKKALTNRIHFYAAVDLRNPDQIKLALSHKLPVVFGFDVYPYFQSEQMEKNGVLNYPSAHELNSGPDGGHCTAIIGHDDSEEMYLIRNSWSKKWGLDGNFKMSYDYVHSQLCSDGWVIRMK